MRKDGYYWVKLNGKWIIGFFENNLWAFVDSGYWVRELDLEEIDEKEIKKQ